MYLYRYRRCVDGPQCPRWSTTEWNNAGEPAKGQFTLHTATDTLSGFVRSECYPYLCWFQLKMLRSLLSELSWLLCLLSLILSCTDSFAKLSSLSHRRPGGDSTWWIGPKYPGGVQLEPMVQNTEKLSQQMLKTAQHCPKANSRLGVSRPLKTQHLLGQLRTPKWFHWVEDLLIGFLFSDWLQILQILLCGVFCLLQLLTIF